MPARTKILPIHVACRTCRAPAGAECVTVTKLTMGKTYHQARLRKANMLNNRRAAFRAKIEGDR